MSFFKKHKDSIILLFILLVAAFLRFYRLDHQSLWYDELYTMNETNPVHSWETFFSFYLKDDHPPLFFILERLMFTWFGYEEHIARILPAIAGVLNVYAIYLLGKEFLSKRLGLIAAAILAINFYAVVYSQEARAYAFFCLFATLSFLYLVRILKGFRTGDIVLFGVVTACMLYSHYFSLLVIFTQLLLIVVLWMNEKESKKQLAVSFFFGMLIALLLYLPWIPYLLVSADTKKQFTDLPGLGFLFHYYADYFGAFPWLYPLLILLPAIYIFYVFRERMHFKNIKTNPLILSFTVLILGIMMPYVVAYTRSVLISSIMRDRYFIFAIPLIVLIHAYAIVLMKNKRLSYEVLAVYIGLVLYNHFEVRKYYTASHKEDLRALTAYISENGPNYTIVNEKSVWGQQFYLNKEGYRGIVLMGDMNKEIDSILQQSSPTHIADTFWLEGGFIDHRAKLEKMAEFEKVFLKVKEQQFYLAWAELWVRRK